MMEVDLAVYDGIVGVLSENFVFDDEEFYEGGDLFFTIAEDFDRYNLKHYHFLNIIKVLSEFHLEKEFVQIPIFDALMQIKIVTVITGGVLFTTMVTSLHLYMIMERH